MAGFCHPLNRAFAAVAAISLLAGAMEAPQDRIDPFFGDSRLSDFYAWDSALDTPGRMLRQESVGEGFFATNASVANRILYSSTDGRFGRGVIEASGLLYLPKGQPPVGGWPMLVWGHGTFGIADVCAPSWRKPSPRDGDVIDGWLKAGFAVIAPDYQGLGTRGVHPYLQREPEGFSVLDAARAALGAYPGRIANKVILDGQSQGSGAVLNATAIAHAYAPDVNLLGTIATALVWRESADPSAVDVTNSEGLRYLAMRMMGGGVKPGSPPPASLWTQKAAPLLRAAATTCAREMIPVTQENGLTPENSFTRPPDVIADLVAPIPVAQQKLRVPVLIATGLADTLIQPDQQYRALGRMCSYGTQITWHRYDGVGHSATANAAMRHAVPFARALLTKQPVGDDCANLKAPGPLQQSDPKIPFNS